MTLFTASATLSMFFMFTKTPLMMALLIVAQTIVVTLSVYATLSSSWLSFVLFIVLVSAMMVIFVYVSSLASNDLLIMPYSALGPTVYLTPLLVLAAYLLLTSQEASLKSQSTLSDMDLSPVSSYKLYAPHTSSITMFLIVYLLVALIVVAKIAMSPKGALRSLAP